VTRKRKKKRDGYLAGHPFGSDRKGTLAPRWKKFPGDVLVKTDPRGSFAKLLDLL